MTLEIGPDPEPTEHHEAWLCAVCVLLGFESGTAVTLIAGTMTCAQHAWEVAKRYPSITSAMQAMGIKPPRLRR